MSSSRGERAAAPARFAAAVTAARDDARARFEKAITSGKRMTRRLRVPRRANPTCVASISSSTGAGGGADPTETPERPSAKALVHAPAEGAGGVRFVSNDDPTPPGPSDEELGVDAREPPAPSPAMSVAGDGAGSAGEAPASEEDTRPILISSVDFEGESPELEQLARSVVRIKPNFSYTVKEIEADVVRVFNTGVFREVRPETVDTRDGISLTFKLAANPVIRGVVIKGCDELGVVARDALQAAVRQVPQLHPAHRGVLGDSEMVRQEEDPGGVVRRRGERRHSGAGHRGAEDRGRRDPLHRPQDGRTQRGRDAAGVRLASLEKRQAREGASRPHAR